MCVGADRLRSEIGEAADAAEVQLAAVGSVLRAGVEFVVRQAVADVVLLNIAGVRVQAREAVVRTHPDVAHRIRQNAVNDRAGQSVRRSIVFEMRFAACTLVGAPQVQSAVLGADPDVVVHVDVHCPGVVARQAGRICRVVPVTRERPASRDRTRRCRRRVCRPPARLSDLPPSRPHDPSTDSTGRHRRGAGAGSSWSRDPVRSNRRDTCRPTACCFESSSKRRHAVETERRRIGRIVHEAAELPGRRIQPVQAAGTGADPQYVRRFGRQREHPVVAEARGILR